MDRRELIRFLGLGTLGLGMACKAARSMPAGSETERFRARRESMHTRLGKIAFTKVGRGTPILFVHAYPLNGYQWRSYLDRLASRHTCIAPDMFGLGYSETVIRDIDPMTQVDMISELLAKLEINSAHIVGNDSGGAIAQLFAAHHPERVRSLLLTNCDVGPDNPPASFQTFVKAAQAGKLIDIFVRPQLADLARARSVHGLGFAYDDPAFLTADAVSYYLSPIVSSKRREEQFNNYTIALGRNLLSGVEHLLRKMEAPTRVVWGAGDIFFNQQDPAYLAALLPNFRGVRYVPQAKLYFPEEMPDPVIEEGTPLWRAG